MVSIIQGVLRRGGGGVKVREGPVNIKLVLLFLSLSSQIVGGSIVWFIVDVNTFLITYLELCQDHP